ncbi:hypothetical protein FQN52_000246 [Onygenales sp. PD_12]|nr:hypothetical protein FQN52_000246 [Onygenales sp. PD_12]
MAFSADSSSLKSLVLIAPSRGNTRFRASLVPFIKIVQGYLGASATSPVPDTDWILDGPLAQCFQASKFRHRDGQLTAAEFERSSIFALKYEAHV